MRRAFPMRWQKAARIAIATFVIAFAAVVFLALRQNRPVQTVAESPRTDPAARVEARGGIEHRTTDEHGKVVFAVKAAEQFVYPDGRVKLTGQPTVTLPDRNGRTVTITAEAIELTSPPDKPRELTTATATGAVRLEASDGLVVTAASATYDNASGVVHVPGAVQFSRGRMTGSATGATYNQSQDLLALASAATIDVAADDKGEGATRATAETAEMARREHYTRLTGQAKIVSEARTTEASQITIHTSADDKVMQRMELRGNSRITGGASAGGGPSNMAAQDIDVTYGPDGRAVQQMVLTENASVDLPATGTDAGRRIQARRIDVSMAPDGATVVGLNATQDVRVDVPAQGDQPSKQIRSATLAATGAQGAGIRHAVFGGNVEYRETRPATRGLPAIDRVTHAQRLIVDTAPGFGALEQADFRSQVRFVDGQTLGEAPRMLYQVTKDLLELAPAAGETGPPPRVRDPQIDVRARTITFSPDSRRLTADTDVRSAMQPRRASEGNRLPSMLKEDQPVLVSANRLEYDSAKAVALYTGAARLWQDQTSVDAASILLEEKTGNLTARGTVRTVMFFEDTDPKTKVRRPARTTGTSEALVYEDGRRLATYTGTAKAQARMVGPQGDVTADRIVLTLAAKANELERAVASGRVVVLEGARRAKGDHLTYTAADETYVMTGKPVEVEEHTPPNCGVTTGATVTFRRAVDNVEVVGIPGVLPFLSTPKPCGAPPRN